MKIWSKQLLMIKPDESPYLMAAKSVRLLSMPGTYLYYTNAAQILTDTLSNRSVLKSPYRISCEVNSAYLYRSYILLRMPGIATVYTSNNSIRVLTEWDNYIYYVDKQYIPDGWISVVLSCENDKIILSVGSVQYTILDATQAILSKSYYGFSNSSYFRARSNIELTGNDTYQFIYSVNTPIVTTTQDIMAQSSIDRTWYVQGASNKMSYYIGSAIVGNTLWNANQDYWVQMRCDGTTVNTYLAIDDRTKCAYELPDVSDTEFWNMETSSTYNILANSSYHLGHNGGANSYWRGSIDLGRALIRINDITVLDRSDWSSVYDMVGVLSYKESYIGPTLPEIYTGGIMVHNNIDVIKNVSALLL